MHRHKVIGFEGAIEHIKPARWLRAVGPDCDIVRRCSSVLSLLFAAQSGFGLTLLPCHIGDQEAGLIRVIDPQPDLTGDFWMLTHPRLRKQAKVRAFFDFMSAEFVRYRPLLRGETRMAAGGKAEGPVISAPAPEAPETP